MEDYGVSAEGRALQQIGRHGRAEVGAVVSAKSIECHGVTSGPATGCWRVAVSAVVSANNGR